MKFTLLKLFERFNTDKIYCLLTSGNLKTLTFDLVFGAGLNNGLKRDPVLSSDAGVGLNSGLKRGLNKLMAWLVTLGIASLWPSSASGVGLLLGFKNPGLRGLSKSAVSTIDQINSLKYLLFLY